MNSQPEPKQKTCTLDCLQPGDCANVSHCEGSGSTFQRLCEMGFVKGAPLRVVRHALFGDPLVVEIQNYHLSLRKAEARMVNVNF